MVDKNNLPIIKKDGFWTRLKNARKVFKGKDTLRSPVEEELELREKNIEDREEKIEQREKEIKELELEIISQKQELEIKEKYLIEREKSISSSHLSELEAKIKEEEENIKKDRKFLNGKIELFLEQRQECNNKNLERITLEKYLLTKLKEMQEQFKNSEILSNLEYEALKGELIGLMVIVKQTLNIRELETLVEVYGNNITLKDLIKNFILEETAEIENTTNVLMQSAILKWVHCINELEKLDLAQILIMDVERKIRRMISEGDNIEEINGTYGNMRKFLVRQGYYTYQGIVFVTGGNIFSNNKKFYEVDEKLNIKTGTYLIDWHPNLGLEKLIYDISLEDKSNIGQDIATTLLIARNNKSGEGRNIVLN